MVASRSSIPSHLGYRWPAEWEPHEATWLAWPCRQETWPHQFLAAVEEFAKLAEAIAEWETVRILAGSTELQTQVQRRLGHHPEIEIWDIPTNDSWIRDFGPTFLKRGPDIGLIHWNFNSWGSKYPYDRDCQVPAKMNETLRFPVFTPGIVMEGGSIEGNGEGTILTTRSCLLQPSRNPSFDQASLERILRGYLGAEEIVWFDGELAGDDTDGHIDQLVRFVGPRQLVVAYEGNSSDVNYVSLQRLYREVVEAGEERGWDVVPLPMPEGVIWQGQRLPASYANFYIANGVVLVPQFGGRGDDIARSILQEAFSDRQIVGLPCRSLVGGLGGFHCLTQQQPK